MHIGRPKTEVKLRFYFLRRNPFAQNGCWTSKTEVKLRFLVSPPQPCRTKWILNVKSPFISPPPSSLSISVPPPIYVSLWWQDTCHMMPFTKQHSAYAWVVTCILFLINLTFHNLSLHSSYKIHQPFTDYFLRLPLSELLEKQSFSLSGQPSSSFFLRSASRFGHGEICSWRDVDSFFKAMRLSLCAFSQADQTEGYRSLRLSKSTSDVCCCWTFFLAGRFAEHGMIYGFYGSIWCFWLCVLIACQ